MAEDDDQRTLRGRDLMGLGAVLAAAVIGGVVVGFLLDRAIGSEPVLTLVGLLAGIVLGAVAFWVRVRAALRG